MILYAQPLSRVAVMTTEQVTVDDDNTTVRLARHDVDIPEPLVSLAATNTATSRCDHIGIGSPTTGTRWLFPGHLPGRPITASQLGARLGPLVIDARAARPAALIQLAAQLPAPVLADSLGITTATATAADWVKAARKPTGQRRSADLDPILTDCAALDRICGLGVSLRQAAGFFRGAQR